MAVTFHIPASLRSFTEGRSKVELEGSPATVAEALEALWASYPGVRDRVVTELGEVRRHVNIFVGDQNIRYTGGLATPIPPSSEVSLVPAISGG